MGTLTLRRSMPIKTIFLCLLVHEGDLQVSAIRFAMDFAVRQGAHLSVGLAAPKFEATTGFLTSEVRGMLGNANTRRRDRAAKIADDIRTMSLAAGVALTSEIVHARFYEVRDEIVRMGRVSDVTVLTRTDAMSPPEREF